MSRTLKVALIGSVLAALVACHRDGDQPAQEQNAATPPAATDGSTAPAAGQDASAAPAAGTTGDAAAGSDASQGTPRPAIRSSPPAIRNSSRPATSRPPTNRSTDR